MSFSANMIARVQDDTPADRRRRKRMVRDMLPAAIDPRVGEAMAALPRQWFCADPALAYTDSALAIGAGQTISQPRMVAEMLSELHLRPGMRVLDIGCGSGYAAALLAMLVGPSGAVITLERQRSLIPMANKALRQAGIDNCQIRHADGFSGWIEDAPYDAIHVACAAPGVPPELEAQMAEGGRMVIPIGASGDTQKLLRVTCRDGRIYQEYLEPVLFVPMLRDTEGATGD